MTPCFVGLIPDAKVSGIFFCKKVTLLFVCYLKMCIFDLSITKTKAIETVYTTTGGDFRIEFNGGKTYMVICAITGDCNFATDTLRKAKNFLKKACYGANVEF